MQQIPSTQQAPVLRTDFSDQDTWEKIRSLIQSPVAPFGFRAYVDFIDDVQYTNVARDQVLSLIAANYSHSFIIIVDRFAISHSEHPLLIIDLFDEAHRDFRATPSQVQGIENNLSIANMDFEDFADSVDADGIFRGFPEI